MSVNASETVNEPVSINVSVSMSICTCIDRQKITARPYAGEADLPLIADFLNACEAVDQEDQYYSASNLQTGFAEPGFDPTQNVRLWETETGDLVAYTDLWTPDDVDSTDGFLWFCVYPPYRYEGIEAEILAWAETRLQAIAKPHLPIHLKVNGREQQSAQLAFYEQQGFEYERCFLVMECSLAAPIAEPQLPDGFQIIQIQEVMDAPKWVEMYNQTFIDHWNFHPKNVEEYHYWISTPQYCPELDQVAVAPDGTFAAFCYGHIDAEYNQHQHRLEGWIHSLGTRRGFRRMGLGRAMLLTGLRHLQMAGMVTAKLAVDTQNPNAAQTLYESVGFYKVHADFSYCKLISPRAAQTQGE